MTTDTTHITKDQSEARKAEVPETEALKPCPFCGGKCDPEGWIGDKKRSGPACDDCGSAAETVAIWNTRAAELSAQESKPVAWEITMTADDPYPPIIKLRRPDGVGMVLTKGDFVYPYFAELAAPLVSAQDASPKDGWKLVPLEPTQEMLMAGAKAGCSTEVLLDDTPFSCDMACWKAMLATSPEPPTCK